MKIHSHTHVKTIAYLLDGFPWASETFILREILELERQGIPLHVFALYDPHDDHAPEAVQEVRSSVSYFPRLPNVPRGILSLLAVTLRRFLRGPGRFLRAGILLMRSHNRPSACKYLFYASHLAERLEREEITHVHVHWATHPVSVAQAVYLLTGIPYSFTAHAYDIYLTSKKELTSKIRFARFVTTCTNYNQRYLQELVEPQVGERIYRIYHGQNLRAFPAPGSVSLSPTPPLLLSVGRLIEKKGFPHLLRACRNLLERGYDFTCRIVGEGPMRPILEQNIRDLELTEHVELWGAEVSERVLAMYLQATIFVLPCIISGDGDRDGVPNVLQEAMYSKVPVVTTELSGIPELIESEVNGLLVPPNDSTALASALARLLDDSALRERLAVAGRQTVIERFDMARNVTQLIDLLYATAESNAGALCVEGPHSSRPPSVSSHPG